jgi:S-DNA-T family DNA segregation ATPase FtsK/SpoIIIE
MARKKKKKFKFPSIFEGLREETIHGIWAVVFFVLAIFFGLAAFNLAGVAGTSVFNFLTKLLGVGYYLLPILFAMLAVTYTGSLREHLGPSRAFGSVTFFISALAFIDLVFEKGGGLIGEKISAPLASFLGVAVYVVLLALIVISIVIMFDIRLSFAFVKSIFKKREKKEKVVAEDEYYDEEYDDEEFEDEEYEDEEAEEDKEDVQEEEKEKPKKKKGLKIFGAGKEKDAEEDEGFKILPSGSEYVPPPLKLLDKVKGKPDTGDIKASANLIKRTFSNFGIEVEMDEVSIGPTVTRYALKPAEGVRLQRITGLQNNLELALAASPVRIEAPIPGKALVGIEVPNSAVAKIGMHSVLSHHKFQKSEIPLYIALGKDVEGIPTFQNLSKMPHCLIAGTTGSGKSVTMHAIINSLLFRNGPDKLRLLLVDPKRVELTLYDGIPHLLAPVITDAKKTILALNWAAKEMNRRYDVLKEHHVRDIDSYHQNVLEPAKEENAEGGIEDADMPEAMPYIVIMIDELADIMLAFPRELEASIVRLAQMSRAVGIHLVISTQRPSVNVITGLIKANIPSRIALAVSSGIDSKTILDQTGAQNLIGKGDMLFMSGEMSKPKRIQSPFISESEVKKVVKYLKKTFEDAVPDSVEFTADNNPDVIFSGTIGGGDRDEAEDELYDEAKQIIIEAGKASTSYLQRKLRIGYARAARLMDMLEDRGIIGPAEGSKPREVLDNADDFEDEEEDDYLEVDGEEEDRYEEEDGDDEEEEDDEDEEEHEEEEDDDEYDEEDEDEEEDEGGLYSSR